MSIGGSRVAKNDYRLRAVNGANIWANWAEKVQQPREGERARCGPKEVVHILGWL